MKTSHAFASLFCLIANCALADPEIAEPEELTNLRKLYLRQVERQLEQPKRVYAAELEKLQKKLGAQGKLEDAILVQKERESLTESTTEIPNPRKPQTPAELEKALENTSWTYVIEKPRDPETRYIILLTENRILFCTNGHLGKWRAVNSSEIEFDYITGNINATGRMKISANLLKWQGNFSTDQVARSGNRITQSHTP